MAGTASIVIDLGYGDSGKGATVASIVSRTQAPVVVRFSGGAQAAHNVVDGPFHHTYRQFGSGTSFGAKTYFAPGFLLNPHALCMEAKELQAKTGFAAPLDEVSCHPDVMVTTPYHIFANRIRAAASGLLNSCGMGIGMTREWAEGEELRWITAGDLWQHDLGYKVKGLYDLAIEESTNLDLPLYVLNRHWKDLPHPRDVVEFYKEFSGRMALRPDTYLDNFDHIVFEGSQGVLIDENYGSSHDWLHYNTYTDVTANKPRLWCSNRGRDSVVYGVTRCYMARHGAGPLTIETDEISPEEPDNVPGQFQGAMRYGWLNVDDLAKAAKHNGGVNRLVVNHLDQWRPGWKVYSAREYCPVANAMGVCDLLAEAIAPVEITGRGRDIDDRRWHNVD